MKTIKTGFGLVAAIAAAVAPSIAAAETAPVVVPPGNSAAAQYTETFPTGSGNQTAGGGKGGHRSPSRVLGAKKTRSLDSHGPQGRATAEVAAATAPAAIATPRGAARQAAETPFGGNGGGAGAPSGNANRTAGERASKQTAPGADGRAAESGAGPQGSSGLGEVVGQATGSPSSGELGWFLPLAILGTILWSLLYLRRHRRPAG